METMLRSWSRIMMLTAPVMLAACQQLPVSGANHGAERLTPGETQRGELTTRSAYNVNDGSRFQRYTIPLEAGQLVRFSLEGALSGTLSLQSPEGDFLAAGRPGEQGMSLSQRAEVDGQYVLSVSGQDHTSYGPYRVSSRLLTVGEGGPLHVGDEVAGWLDGAVDTYTLEVSEVGLYQVTMRSEDMDAYLTLRGVSEPLHQEDDDSAGGLDARLTGYLSPGLYEIDAGWTQQQSRGLYSLAVTMQPLPEGRVLQQSGQLSPGETVEGWVSGGPLEYTLVIDRTSQVQLDMTSAAVDAYLELMGETMALSDDDGGEHYNARIEALLPPGTYQVLANEVSGDEGLFELTATVTPFDLAGALEGLPVIRAGTDEHYQLSGTTDHYRLVINESGRYALDMRSGELDAFLELYGDSGAWQDDDGGANTDARVAALLPAGEYLLVARSFDRVGTGSYQLTVRRD